MTLRVGLVVNPLAGLGGSVALKGSDGAETVAEALRRGAQPQAPARAAQALRGLGDRLRLFTWGGAMGEESCRAADVECEVLATPAALTTSDDTRRAVRALEGAGIDLLVFAGGDGTARDVASVLSGRLPVLGIPAGCKMHSGVYAVNPGAARARLLELINGAPLHLREAEVRDIDEDAFRAGRVESRLFGTLLVADAGRFVQQVKTGGRPSDALEAIEIAAWVAETMVDQTMSPGVTWFIGSGSTVAEVMGQLHLPNTLLGVDMVRDGVLVAPDVTAAQMLAALERGPCRAVLSVIGGQGHLFGRGNQQFTPEVIRRLGKENLVVLATPGKLQSLEGRPLLVDTGDSALDHELGGLLPVICGYDHEVLYPVASEYAAGN